MVEMGENGVKWWKFTCALIKRCDFSCNLVAMELQNESHEQFHHVTHLLAICPKLIKNLFSGGLVIRASIFHLCNCEQRPRKHVESEGALSH